MIEYAFDITLIGSMRVVAPTQDEAERLIRETLDCASVNAGAWPDGSPIVFEASVDGSFHLFEVDGETVG